MISAYEEILLDRASGSLGRMLDYSVHSLRYDISVMLDLFSASGVASSFERGDIRTITGMSGIELAYEVLAKSGISYERTLPRYTKGLSPEYWYGFALARIQWETCLPFGKIAVNFPGSAFVSEYSSQRLAFLDALPLSISEEERAAKIKDFGSQFAAEAVSRYIALPSAGPSLKTMRLRNRLSQSQLAKASGVPVRTIQQYEQGQKNLRKANAEYLIALSRALNCDPANLI